MFVMGDFIQVGGPNSQVPLFSGPATICESEITLATSPEWVYGSMYLRYMRTSILSVCSADGCYSQLSSLADEALGSGAK